MEVGLLVEYQQRNGLLLKGVSHVEALQGGSGRNLYNLFGHHIY